MQNMISFGIIVAYGLFCLWALKYYLASISPLAKTLRKENIILECTMSAFVMLAIWCALALPSGIFLAFYLLSENQGEMGWNFPGRLLQLMHVIGYGSMLFIALKQLQILRTALPGDDVG